MSKPADDEEDDRDDDDKAIRRLVVVIDVVETRGSRGWSWLVARLLPPPPPHTHTSPAPLTYSLMALDASLNISRLSSKGTYVTSASAGERGRGEGGRRVRTARERARVLVSGG